MSFSVSSFRSALKGGARPNLFNFTLGALPTGVSISDFGLMAKAGAIPGMTLGVVEVPFRGRRIKVPGDRTFAEWTVTVINNESQLIRTGFENWMKYINDNDFTTTNMRTGSGVDYTTDITVAQLGDAGNTVRSYKLVNAFPSDVSTIDLSYDTTDAIEEFTVTFQYTHFEVINIPLAVA